MSKRTDPFDPENPNRKPTPAEVLQARERLGVNQREFGRILRRGNQGTISSWENGVIVPSISLRLMEERIAEYVGQGAAPARADGFALDPRSYALGTLANLGDDVAALRGLADRMAAKVQAATATLGGTIPPSVVMDSSTQSGLDAVDALHGHPARAKHKHR